MKLDPFLISQLNEANLNIEQWAVLNNLDIDYWRSKEVILSLDNLGLVDLLNSKPNLQGLQLMQLINHSVTESKELFKLFWETYPDTDEWAHYPKTRKIKTGKVKAQIEFSNLIYQEENPDIIMEGLNSYIQDLQHKSKKEDNKLKYMVSPARFLNEKVYRDFLDNTFQPININIF